MKEAIKSALAVILAVVVASGFYSAPARGQTEVKKDGPCSGPEHHQFDFWIGHWEVKNPAGVVVGTNRIDRILGGCSLQENWEGKGGSNGTSLNLYNAEDGKWHQIWVDNSGSLLRLSGGIEDGRMVMSGTTKSAAKPGGQTLQRISWEPREDGTVRQLWEASKDDGKTWTVAFDGIYSRMK